MAASFTSRGRFSWQRPDILLYVLAAGVPLSFATWQALLNNFAIERAAYTGVEIGILQSLREVPGFLAFTTIFVLLVLREQTFALVSLALLGLGTAITGLFPSVIGLYCTTVLMSIGFHYFQTLQISLSLQWVSQDKAPEVLGRIIAVGAFASLATFGLIYLTKTLLHLDYVWVYIAGGGATVLMALVAWLAFPRIDGEYEQYKHLVLRKRYWLYYALTFMSGARRQIFIVFAAFMMVEKFGYSVEAVTLLFLINCVFNMFFATWIGRLVHRFGERLALTIEYVGLVVVFTAYAFVESPLIAAGLYIIDHAFFAMAIAMKTYFQKIADPRDIAPTAGVSFTINHIAAVFLPVLMGFVWIFSPELVFLAGAAMAFVSLLLARLVPERPAPGTEVIWSERAASVPAE
ncbi:MAG: MFS transporter [Alphaproteobacteria bacterium]|nr:MFS transporter [Alphaproteobacteria bacterium]